MKNSVDPDQLASSEANLTQHCSNKGFRILKKVTCTVYFLGQIYMIEFEPRHSKMYIQENSDESLHPLSLISLS